MTTQTPDGSATVAVVGAGQAGLSAAHHLRRRGFRALREPGGTAASGVDRTVVVLDANPRPGGAWQHRWAPLRMATVNGIHDLPGMPLPPVDADESANSAVPRYFAAYESHEDLPVLRPVRVDAVAPLDDRPDGPLLVTTDHGSWRVRTVVNATGTWNTPVVPDVPGAETFLGEQLHSRGYTAAERFRGRRVAVVGGGVSAVQLLGEISLVTSTVWYTRREPVFLPGGFVHEVDGVDVERRVAADVRAGRPPASIVSYTGLVWTDAARDAARRGVLDRRPMFTRMRPHGVVEADGSDTSVDVVLWATGYRADLDHLAPMRLRGPLGGVPVVGTQVVGEPRVHLIGYGPSQSTVGANRAGRSAARDLDRWLDEHPGPLDR
ncbi:pyridine nucleotide-disulfide oxidoreductase [Curtobacterium sp. MCSS17_008]|uniref:NAD(P)-binding domain-containing protein n=1 Tax=Curtobacterium sp. MCSS17_008 TaxID=2175647 RepID=UPI000DA7EEFB|nr:NAD(P)-binding domain-containing protein [Curtobacterium sp. MCSS17_008]PZF54952.1 pyridine nucleotide-disulfide oxidoreductase [Curtobacterium sp. MCSS17_008]